MPTTEKQINRIMKKYLFLSIVMVALTLMSCSASNSENKSNAAAIDKADNNMTKVELETSLGNIVVELYDETPQHRDNFIKLVNAGYYDGVLFHRVIKDFMIQTGDGNSKTAGPDAMLGDGDPGYTIEAEFVYPKYFHKRGALAAARTADQVNPERRSSGSQFYIVTGKIYSSDELKMMTQRMADMRKQDIFRRLVTENRERIEALQMSQDQAGIQELQNELIQLTEAEAASKGLDYVALKLPMAYAGRFVAENERGEGLCKVIVEGKNHRVLGVHMLGNPCSEMIHSACIAIEQGMTVEELKKVVFPHPTVSEIFKETAFRL